MSGSSDFAQASGIEIDEHARIGCGKNQHGFTFHEGWCRILPCRSWSKCSARPSRSRTEGHNPWLATPRRVEDELSYPAVVERDGAGLAAPVRAAQKAAGGVIATRRHAVGARRYKPVAAVQRSPPERTQQSSAPERTLLLCNVEKRGCVRCGGHEGLGVHRSGSKAAGGCAKHAGNHLECVDAEQLDGGVAVRLGAPHEKLQPKLSARILRVHLRNPWLAKNDEEDTAAWRT